MYWLAINPKVRMATDHGTEISKSVRQNKTFFFLSCLSDIICYTNRKMTNIIDRQQK
jgi:hypothetical protein